MQNYTQSLLFQGNYAGWLISSVLIFQNLYLSVVNIKTDDQSLRSTGPWKQGCRIEHYLQLSTLQHKQTLGQPLSTVPHSQLTAQFTPLPEIPLGVNQNHIAALDRATSGEGIFPGLGTTNGALRMTCVVFSPPEERQRIHSKKQRPT